MTTDEQQLQKEFVWMLHRNERVLYKLCYRYTDQSHLQVKELYQDMVFHLWKGFSSFRGKGKELTWVYRVAYNTACQYCRNRNGRPQIVELDKDICDTLADTDADPLITRLYELIDKLQPDDKELLYMYLDRVPIKKMAATYKCTPRTILNRLHNIKQYLKEINEHED